MNDMQKDVDLSGTIKLTEYGTNNTVYVKRDCIRAMHSTIAHHDPVATYRQVTVIEKNSGDEITVTQSVSQVMAAINEQERAEQIK